MDVAPGSGAQTISRITWSMVAVVTFVALIVGLAVSLPLELGIIGFVLSFFFARSIRQSAPLRIHESMATHAASEIDQARIFNVVDGLCVVSGDHRPTIEVVDSEFPVAAAFGNTHDSVIVVSNGFCAQMDRVETEAVMAHLLWRIRSGDAELTTYLLHFVAQLSRVGLSSLARRVAARSLNEQAIMWADIAACQATRYPPALASALEKVQSSTAAAPLGASTPLWFATPVAGRGDTHAGVHFSSLGVSYPSLADRIGVLKEI